MDTEKAVELTIAVRSAAVGTSSSSLALIAWALATWGRLISAASSPKKLPGSARRTIFSPPEGDSTKHFTRPSSTRWMPRGQSSCCTRSSPRAAWIGRAAASTRSRAQASSMSKGAKRASRSLASGAREGGLQLMRISCGRRRGLPVGRLAAGFHPAWHRGARACLRNTSEVVLTDFCKALKDIFKGLDPEALRPSIEVEGVCPRCCPGFFPDGDSTCTWRFPAGS